MQKNIPKRGYFQRKNQKERKEKMKNYQCQGSGYVTKMVVFVCAILLSWALIAYGLIAKTKTPSIQHKQDPREFIALLSSIEENKGTPQDQVSAIEKISEALKTGKVTSVQLGKKGDYWLHALRRKVAVREAVIALGEIKKLEARSKELSEVEISEAEKLFDKASRQIGAEYADSEGFNLNPGDLWRMMYHIRHKGENPL